MTLWIALLAGVVGAFFIYAVCFRTERLRDFLAHPKDNWRVMLFDLLLFLMLGGLVVVFVVEPKSAKEAFLGGATWEGFVSNVIPTKPTAGGG